MEEYICKLRKKIQVLEVVVALLVIGFVIMAGFLYQNFRQTYATYYYLMNEEERPDMYSSFGSGSINDDISFYPVIPIPDNFD